MNRKISPPAVGASSLLVIFAVLCLATFALLSIATVQADGRLSTKALLGVTEYYAADCQAEQILARLRSGELPDGVTEDHGVYTYTCPISDTQILAVQVVLEEDTYRILRWQAISSLSWKAEDHIPVWNGTTE